MVPNLGLLFYLFVFHIVAIPFVLMLMLASKKAPKLRKASQKARNYMFYSGFIRFMTEGYLDFAMFALMNLKGLDWSDNFVAVTWCNYIAIFFTAVACLFPIVLAVWYISSQHRWDD